MIGRRKSILALFCDANFRLKFQVIITCMNTYIAIKNRNKADGAGVIKKRIHEGSSRGKSECEWKLCSVLKTV